MPRVVFIWLRYDAVMDELRIVAPWHDLSGYSKHARALLRTAILAGYRVEAVESDYRTEAYVRLDAETGGFKTETRRVAKGDLKWAPAVQVPEVEEALATKVPMDAPTILLQLPMMMDRWREYSSGPRIGYTMVECDSLRPEVSRAMQGVDLVLAPSMFVEHVFMTSGPHSRVLVLPDQVDDRVLPLDAAPLPVAGKPAFLFVSVGSSHERKHWRELMHGFAEEFTGEDVGLIMKANPSQDMQALAAACREYGAWVKVEDEPWSEERMAGLYQAADCIVGIGHEGFGLPFVEGAFFGKASVALDRGGAADFVGWESGYPVRSEMVPCAGLIPRYFPSYGKWASCSVRNLRIRMRTAYVDRLNGALDRRGQTAKQKAQAYTPAAMAPRLREVVDLAWKIWTAGGADE